MPKNDFTRKINILTPLQKLPKNVGDLHNLIVAKGFKKLPKDQKNAHSGHTGYNLDRLVLKATALPAAPQLANP